MTGRSEQPGRWQALRALLWPAPLAIDARERWRLTVGVAIGLLFAAVVARVFGSDPWLVAPIGASAVIVFALPSSPLAQPWAVIGGNTVSALAGITAVHFMQIWGGGTLIATVFGAALATGTMVLLRCLHPPGGAAAVLVALGGVLDWRFALVPVCLDSLLLVLAGALYNRVTGKAYPHPPALARAQGPGRFTDADIDRVLGRWNQVLDVPRDELHALLESAEAEAYRRRVDTLSCSEVMSRDVAAVEYGTPLNEAWALLRKRGVKALPVVDRWRHVVGVITLADFLDGAGLDQHEGVGERLRKLLKPSPGLTSDKPEVVGQLMTRRVQVVSAHNSLAALVPVFSVTGHHHLPVVDEKLRLVGIITQTDLVRALQRQG